MPPTMIVRLVADIQNRLFWHVALVGLLSAALPMRVGARHHEMGSNRPAEQGQRRAL